MELFCSDSFEHFSLTKISSDVHAAGLRRVSEERRKSCWFQLVSLTYSHLKLREDCSDDVMPSRLVGTLSSQLADNKTAIGCDGRGAVVFQRLIKFRLY